MRRRREIESYLTTSDVLVAYARRLGEEQLGPLLAGTAETNMRAAIEEVVGALVTLGRPDPFGPDAKVSDDFLDPVFRKFLSRMGLPEGTMRKTDYHMLAPFLERDAIDQEVVEKLDAIADMAGRAKPAGEGEP